MLHYFQLALCDVKLFNVVLYNVDYIFILPYLTIDYLMLHCLIFTNFILHYVILNYLVLSDLMLHCLCCTISINSQVYPQNTESNLTKFSNHVYCKNLKQNIRKKFSPGSVVSTPKESQFSSIY